MGKRRITVIHRNVKFVLNSITDIVSGAGINIENFVSQSRGDYAYTILDLESDVDDKLLAKVCACDNIIKVRKI